MIEPDTDEIETPCRHLNSRVTCVECLNDEIDAIALLANLNPEDAP
jgi:hypothetical protein